MPRPHCRPVKPELLGVGWAGVFLAIPSIKSKVQLNLRISDSELQTQPPTLCREKEIKGHDPLMDSDGRGQDSGKASDCAMRKGQKQNPELPAEGHLFPGLASSHHVPATQLPINQEWRRCGYTLFYHSLRGHGVRARGGEAFLNFTCELNLEAKEM